MIRIMLRALSGLTRSSAGVSARERFDDSKDDAGDGAGTSVIARLFGKDD